MTATGATGSASATSGSAGSSSSVARPAPRAVDAVGADRPWRIIEIATQVSTTANSPARTCSSRAKASSPPASAPIAVNSSSTMPSRRFATWRRRYTPAPALEVTITATSEIATASRSGNPNASVSSGTRSRPPPSPSSDPNRPAAAPPATRISPAVTGRT